MKNSNLPKPRIVAFEITRQCQYHCLHCRANAAQELSEHELTTSQCLNLGDLWENSVLLQQLRDRTQLTGTCGHCPYTDQCGGCRARAYALTGDVLGDDPICILSNLKAEQNERDYI